MKKSFAFELSLGHLLIIVAILCILIAIVFNPQLVFTDTIIATVTDKQVKRYSDDDDKYLVFCTDENDNPIVFEDTDNLIPIKFNSSDIYASIKEGNTYEFYVRGLRIRILSMYQNIYKVKKVK